MISVGRRSHTAIGKLDIKPHSPRNRRGRTQWMSVAIPHKCEPARKHSAIGVSRQQLPGAAQAFNAPIPKNSQGAKRAIAKGSRLFLAAFNTVRQKPWRKA